MGSYQLLPDVSKIFDSTIEKVCLTKEIEQQETGNGDYFYLFVQTRQQSRTDKHLHLKLRFLFDTEGKLFVNKESKLKEDNNLVIASEEEFLQGTHYYCCILRIPNMAPQFKLSISNRSGADMNAMVLIYRKRNVI